MHESHKKIHKHLKKYHPQAVKKAKKIFAFKYPKLFLLLILIGVAYYIFSLSSVTNWIESFEYTKTLSGIWIFISGALTSFGFTAPFGIGLLAKITPQNIFLETIIAALGATMADLFIFKTIKFSFMNEFEQLEKTKAVKEIEKIVKKNKHVLIRHYLLYIFAGIVIATPLPDELGVSMLAGLTTIKPMKMAVIGFILHALMLFMIFYFL